MDDKALHGVSFSDGEKVILIRYVNGEKIMLVRHVDEETKNKINLDPEFVKEFIRKELLKEEKNGSKQVTSSSASEKSRVESLEEAEETISSTVEFMKGFTNMSEEKNDNEKDSNSLDPEKPGITLITDGSNSSSSERTNWTHEMTELMLSTLADNKEDFVMPHKKKSVFIRVRNKLLQSGHSFTVNDISKKYSNLIQTYRRHKERRSKGEDYKCWIYFDIIDEIIGSSFEDLSTPKKHVSSTLLPDVKIELHSRSPSPFSSVPSTSNFEPVKRKRTGNEERESIEERKLMLLESLINSRKRETSLDDDNIGKKLQKLNSAIDEISESAHSMAKSASSIAESALNIAASVNKISNLLATNYKSFSNNLNNC